VNFDTYTMRDHLIKCIESQQFSPFPKTKPTRTKVLSLKNTSVHFSIEKECTATCRCNLPNCLKIWYVVIDVLLGTITVVFPATTRTLFLVIYRLPVATVTPLLKDFVCRKQYLVSDIIIARLYHSWWDVFSKTVPIAGLTKSLNEMIFIFFINICLIHFLGLISLQTNYF
jgi:hypothetical protein